MLNKEKDSNITFLVLGISHWNTPIEVRERFSFSNEKRISFFDRFKEFNLGSCFIISTCNRTELYAMTHRSDLTRELFEDSIGIEKNIIQEHLYEKQSIEALEHLFEMSIGLDSQILGDMQIISQVKFAFNEAYEYGAAGSIMHRLMQHVAQACKKARTETDLCSGAASIAHAGVLYVQDAFEHLEDKNILLFGAGKIGEATCKNFIDKGINKVTLINRTENKGRSISEKYDIQYKKIEHLTETIAQSDIIIVATGSYQPTITQNHIPQNGFESKKVFLDLSVPRNITPEIKENNGITLVNLDELRGKQTEVLEKRKTAVPITKEIIKNAIDEYLDWIHQRNISPTIKAFREKIHGIKTNEMKIYKKKFSDEEWMKVEKITASVVNRIVNHGIEQLKNNYKKEENLLDAFIQLHDLKDVE